MKRTILALLLVAAIAPAASASEPDTRLRDDHLAYCDLSAWHRIDRDLLRNDRGSDLVVSHVEPPDTGRVKWKRFHGEGAGLRWFIRGRGTTDTLYEATNDQGEPSTATFSVAELCG